MRTIRRWFGAVLLIFALAACGAPTEDTTPSAPSEETAESGPAEDATSSDPPVDDDAIDLIIAGDYVVTMDGERSVIEDGAVAVDDGVILAVGPAAEITSNWTARQTLEGDGRIVMPGLINGHSHAAMTLLRGVADDLALMDWLLNYIFPAEVQFVDAEFVRIGTELACWEMIRGGTTTFVDM